MEGEDIGETKFPASRRCSREVAEPEGTSLLPSAESARECDK